MTPQEFYWAEIGFFAAETAMLAGILWQGWILIRNDQEKLRLDRDIHRATMERLEERAKWREQKRQQTVKKSEPSEPVAKNTESPQPFTTQSESPKDGAAESVADPKAISKPV